MIIEGPLSNSTLRTPRISYLSPTSPQYPISHVPLSGSFPTARRLTRIGREPCISVLSCDWTRSRNVGRRLTTSQLLRSSGLFPSVSIVPISVTKLKEPPCHRDPSLRSPSGSGKSYSLLLSSLPVPSFLSSSNPFSLSNLRCTNIRGAAASISVCFSKMSSTNSNPSTLDMFPELIFRSQRIP